MSVARLAPLLLSAVCLSGCAGGAPDAVGRYPAAPPSAEGPALAALPAAAGRVVAVRGVPHANGVSQQIVLDGPRAMAGENRIVVEALTTAGGGGRGARGDDLRVGPPSDTEIAAEMEAQVPGVPMRISTEVEHDALGPFGYAVGAMGRLTCIYAWQYLAPSRPLSLIEGASDGGVHPVSIRVRLCRDLPAGALVDLVRRLSVTQPGAGLPAAAAGRPGTGGDALEAAVGSLPPTAAEPRAPAPAAARPARHRALARPAASRAAVAHPRAAAPGRMPLRRAPVTAGLPRLPLPGDVTAAAPTPQRASAVAAPRAAAVESDAMPLPR